MARAFSVFGNEGRDVTPIAIRSVEDRNGRVVLDNEREIRLQQRRTGNAQIISRENAYVMTKILEKTVEQGTLAHGAGWGAKFTFRDENNKSFRMPVAGKTGTTQNWSDAWAVGYSPYYTTAIWFGFAKPGNSLGVELTGATLCGPIWGDYMREIHQGLPRRDFVRPATGTVDVTVCAKSGMLRNSACNEGEVTLPFLTGTQPSRYCTIHGNTSLFSSTALGTMRDDTLWLDQNSLIGSLPMPSLPEDLFPSSQGTQNQNNRNTSNNNRGSTSNNRNTPSSPATMLPLWDFSNPWTDNEDPFWQLDLPNIQLSPPEAPVESGNPTRTEPTLQTSSIINDDVGFGLEVPSYDPLSD
jgi:penicillin-binding protein 1A